MQTLILIIISVLLIGCTDGISLRTFGRNRQRSKRNHAFIRTDEKPDDFEFALQQLKEEMEIQGIQRLEIANQDCWFVKNSNNRISVTCSSDNGGFDFFGKIGGVIGFKHPDHLSIGVNGKY